MLIRKISIGTDYKSSMHFVVDQPVLDKSYAINCIVLSDDGAIDIFIKRNDEIVKWKTFGRNVPIIIEYKIDF
jgi:hypothetical protein